MTVHDHSRGQNLNAPASPSPATDLPTVDHVYQNHSLDSRRWAWFVPHDDDVIIVSSYKSGTTWLQAIVLSLLEGSDSHKVPELSPLEAPFASIETVLARIEHQSRRRVVKTHLPLDGLPYHRNVKYLVVCRDPRDVFVSLWNHYRNLIRYPFLAAPAHPRRIGAPLPKPPSDVREFWMQWITRGWFAWETEGYPFWSNLRHTRTWWNWRHLPNVKFVHFSDMLADLPEEIRSVASFLNVSLDDRSRQQLAASMTFAQLRARAERLLPNAHRIFRGGAASFFQSGKRGMWRDVLTPEDLRLYYEAAERELSSACRHWLEEGNSER